MKKLTVLLMFIQLLCSMVQVCAQSDNNKNKILMTVNSEGKVTSVELSSICMSISRYENRAFKEKIGTKFCLKLKLGKKGDDNILKVFSKKQIKVDGSIVLAPVKANKPPKIITFTKASLETYKKLFKEVSDDDLDSEPVSLSLICTSLAVDGIAIE